ncbi:MAG: MarR family winged helix-turn-helix transcriptional regulator [Chlorobium sp.]|nr:MarR family winged helix-turn-helix transcriptional regulator [Chlorobium sp.]MCW8814578.1 MarR family winged helix-turn-helix transcriptional regulator [Chlorobium sp.]MCW8819432.1 MarR family winged helix-turn-helix transcriptional regulator [Ignavibacteriaceae bacterium]
MSGKEYSVKGFVGHQLGLTAGVLRKAFASRITKSAESISPEQFVVLVRLSSGQGFNQNEIAEYLLKDDASITRILDSLEKKGLAVRKKAEHDRRANIAFITERGTALVEKVFPMVERLNGQLLEGIEADQIENVFVFLEKLRENAMNISTL